MEIIQQLRELLMENKIYKGFVKLPFSKYKELDTFLNKYSSDYLMCPEIGKQEGEHFHFIIINNNNLTLDTLKKKIRESFPELKREGKGGLHRYSVQYPKVLKSIQNKTALSFEEQHLKQVLYITKEVTFPMRQEVCMKRNNIDLFMFDVHSIKIMKETYLKLLEKDYKLLKDKKSIESSQDRKIFEIHIDNLKKKFVGADGNPALQNCHIDDIEEYLFTYYLKHYKFKDPYQIAKEAIFLDNYIRKQSKDKYLELIKTARKKILDI